MGSLDDFEENSKKVDLKHLVKSLKVFNNASTYDVNLLRGVETVDKLRAQYGAMADVAAVVAFNLNDKLHKIVLNKFGDCKDVTIDELRFHIKYKLDEEAEVSFVSSTKAKRSFTGRPRRPCKHCKGHHFDKDCPYH